MAAAGDKALLRFLACGSVDDGKSTLIGRLLFESGAIPDDQLAALERDSKRFGTQGGATDYALLLDGLIAEREQNITIDVAYRYFSTGRRAFIVADAPGHEQYTRNMATAASTSDAAVILVDARKGLLPQTCRHSCIARLLGIRHVALAVNKLDVADYSRDVFDAIATRYREFAARIGLQQVTCLPLSALRGDNVSSPSDRMPWYEGPTLRDWLETVEPERRAEDGAFRMPVQWVNRPGPDFRGYCGPVVGGRLRPGDRVRVQPSGVDAVVARIVERDGDLAEARAGQSVTVVLDRDLDVARGDLLAAADSPAQVSDQFQATIVWMGEADMLPGRRYLIKAGTRTVGLAFGTPRHKLNIETLERVAARTLQLNDIGVCHIALDAPIAFDPYKANRDTGSFIVIDRTTNATVGAGMLDYGLHRAQNLHGQAFEVDKAARAALKGQKPCVVWFTGLSGAGKSTIANLVEKRLHAAGVHTCLLDGDNIRQGLNRDLGFTEAARVENIRRVAEVAKLMVDAGLVVLVAFISPFRAERRFARSLVEPGEFFEVFVDAPLAEAERRDPKGLYRKARRGELANFTGIDSPYEPPENPEARIDTTATTAEEAADALIVRMRLR